MFNKQNEGMTGKAGTAKEVWEHIAVEYYPEDLSLSFEEAADQEERNELYSWGLHEIECIDVDINNGDYEEGAEEAARAVADEYVRVLMENGFSIPEWVNNLIEG